MIDDAVETEHDSVRDAGSYRAGTRCAAPLSREVRS